MLAGFLLTSKNALAQNIASNQKKTTAIENTNGVANNANILDMNNPLVFAEANVGKYYPDMIDYTKKLMSSFWNNEQRNIVSNILSKIVSKYSDPKEKIRFIIGTLENNVTTDRSLFVEKYWTEPTDLDLACDEEFSKNYKIRFYTYEKKFNENLVKLENEISNTKNEISQQIKEISDIMNNFSKEDVLKDKKLYNLVKETKERSIKYKWTTTTHMKDLFSVIK